MKQRNHYIYDEGNYQSLGDAIADGAVTNITDEYNRDPKVCEDMVNRMNERFNVSGVIGYVTTVSA